MAQSLARLWADLIFSTKNRFPFLSDKQIRADMHGYLAKVLREHDCETLIVGGVEDHVTLYSLSGLFHRQYSFSLKRHSGNSAKPLKRLEIRGKALPPGSSRGVNERCNL